MTRILLFLLVLFASATAPAASIDDLLEPEKAFRMSARAIDARTVEVKFAIAEGYYMYRERFKFALAPGSKASLGVPQFPDGIRKKDEFFGEVETYRGQVAIRLPVEKGQSTADLSQKVTAMLKVQDATAEVRRVEFVGPQVGEELAEYGALALLVTAVGIVFYLWIRFEWRFGLAAIIANLHDVVIILGFFALFQWEFSLPVLAAVLAVLGYSVNESVVVFDRVRENFRKMRKATVPDVIDSAITGVT